MVRMRLMSKGLVLLALSALLAGGASAAVFYQAELLPENVRPGSGASAYGQATIIVHDDETLFSLTVNFAGLDAPQTAAALLIGAEDEVGAVVVELPLGSPLAMNLPYTAEIAAAIVDDRLAIQVHSVDWPDGAIRGNFSFVTVGVDQASWTRVKSLFN